MAQAKTRKRARDPDAFKGIMTRMNADGWRTLRILAAEQDTTLNQLNELAGFFMCYSSPNRRSMGQFNKC